MDRLAGRAKPTSSPSGKRPGSAPAPGAPPASQPQLPYSHRAPRPRNPIFPSPYPPTRTLQGNPRCLELPARAGQSWGGSRWPCL